MSKHVDADALLAALYDADAITPRGAKIIREFPAVEDAQIIRCGDCKWWTKQESSAQGRCALFGIYPTRAWFCANGSQEELTLNFGHNYCGVEIDMVTDCNQVKDGDGE